MYYYLENQFRHILYVHTMLTFKICRKTVTVCHWDIVFLKTHIEKSRTTAICKTWSFCLKNKNSFLLYFIHSTPFHSHRNFELMYLFQKNYVTDDRFRNKFPVFVELQRVLSYYFTFCKKFLGHYHLYFFYDKTKFFI